MTRIALLLAAILALALGAAHSILGERLFIGPLLLPEARQGLLARSARARRTLRSAWHLTTIAWWGFAAILIALAVETPGSPGRLVPIMVAATFCVTAIVIFASSRGRHFAWPIFLAMAGLSLAPLL